MAASKLLASIHPGSVIYTLCLASDRLRPRGIPGCEWRDAELASPGEEGNVFASRVWKGIAEPTMRGLHA